MAETKTKTPTLLDCIDGEFEQKDGDLYVQIRTLTGLSEDGIKNILAQKRNRLQFSADFFAWMRAGKPVPQMPKDVKGEVVAYTRALTRLRDRGEDKMYALLSNGKYIGVTRGIDYVKETNPETGEVKDTEDIASRYSNYTEPFNAHKAKELIADAHSMMGPAENLKLYITKDTITYGISAENFVKPWDEITGMINDRKTIV